MSLNKVILIGTVTGVPIHRSAGASPICEFEVVTTETWQPKEGAARTETERHQVVVFGRQAEALRELRPGNEVFIEGQIKTPQAGPRAGSVQITVGFKGEARVLGYGAPIGIARGPAGLGAPAAAWVPGMAPPPPPPPPSPGAFAAQQAAQQGQLPLPPDDVAPF